MNLVWIQNTKLCTNRGKYIKQFCYPCSFRIGAAQTAWCQSVGGASSRDFSLWWNSRSSWASWPQRVSQTGNDAQNQQTDDSDIILQFYFFFSFEAFQLENNQNSKNLMVLILYTRTSLKKKGNIHLMDQILISSFSYISGNFTSVTPANSLIERWQARALHPLLDTEAVWDNVVTNRW